MIANARMAPAGFKFAWVDVTKSEVIRQNVEHVAAK